MKAIDIIKKCANILNLREILDDDALKNLNAGNSNDALDNNFTLNRMFEILKIMLKDIASDSIPIYDEVEVKSENKLIPLNNFKNLVRINLVKMNNVPVKFKLLKDNIKVELDGIYSVKYTMFYEPENLVSEIDYGSKISEDILVYGLISLYTLAVGLFDEFNIYNEIYNERLKSQQELKILEMPYRRWE